MSSSFFPELPFDSQPPLAEEPNASAVAAGFDLGGCLFVAALLQLISLSMTTAARSTFIMQLATVIVLLMDAHARSWPTPGVCVLAFGGVTALARRAVPEPELAAGSPLAGDGPMCVAALI